MTAAEPPVRSGMRLGPLLVVLGVGAGVAVLLGVYGGVHTPTGQAVNLAGFSSNKYAKAWLTTAAFVLALVQITTSLIIFDKIKLSRPRAWISPLHRWSGRIAVLLTVPVAVDCLYAFGFATFDARVLIHSLLGCTFYGAFATKMLVLSRKGLPGWTLPVVGGVLFSVMVGLWLTAGLYVFASSGVHF